MVVGILPQGCLKWVKHGLIHGTMRLAATHYPISTQRSGKE
jgi:hypothetical protein